MPDNFTNHVQSFPHDIEVQITLKVRVSDQEARDYWLNPQTNAVSMNTLADIFDSYEFDNMDDSIVTINNLTKEQIQQFLNAEAAL